MYNVLGIEKVNYRNKQGNVVNGTRLHLGYENDKVYGMGTEVIYCSGDTGNHVKLDDTVRVLYNKYGKVESVLVEE